MCCLSWVGRGSTSRASPPCFLVIAWAAGAPARAQARASCALPACLPARRRQLGKVLPVHLFLLCDLILWGLQGPALAPRAWRAPPAHQADGWLAPGSGRRGLWLKRGLARMRRHARAFARDAAAAGSGVWRPARGARLLCFLWGRRNGDYVSLLIHLRAGLLRRARNGARRQPLRLPTCPQPVRARAHGAPRHAPCTEPAPCPWRARATPRRMLCGRPGSTLPHTHLQSCSSASRGRGGRTLTHRFAGARLPLLSSASRRSLVQWAASRVGGLID